MVLVSDMERIRKYKLKRIGFVSASIIFVYGLELFSHSLYLLGVFSKKWLAFVRSGATPEEAAREGRIALEQSRRRGEAPFIHRVSAASPTCTITAPSAGATVSGATTSVTATATGSAPLRVQFHLDGANLGAQDTSSPFGISWNTTTAANGSHALSCTTTNQYGETTTGASISVTVNNTDTTPPSAPTGLAAE